MRCEICGAPALPLRGRCVFCFSPLEGSGDPSGLLEYLAERLPRAEAKRSWFGRGPLRELSLRASGSSFALGRRPGGLRMRPPAPPAEWVDLLLTALSEEAATDAPLRSRMTRAGWALR